METRIRGPIGSKALKAGKVIVATFHTTITFSTSLLPATPIER
jgi:hypothetical protein